MFMWIVDCFLVIYPHRIKTGVWKCYYGFAENTLFDKVVDSLEYELLSVL